MFTAPTPHELVATVLFAVAVIHTFSTKALSRLAQRHPRHAGLLHLLGEVEVVFGLWALVLAIALFALSGSKHHFLDDAVSPLGLLLAAAAPTGIAIFAFQGLPHG